MTDRKKKLRVIQISLLILGIIIIFFTYGEKNKFSNEKDKLFKFTEKNVEKNSKDTSEEDLNTFYNIEYSGLDLSGNRYILKSEKAISSNKNSEIIDMTGVKAFFYFKDDTILTVSSDHAIYNNKTLDMLFNKNIIAIYENSKLTADKADYSNTLGLLTISDKVKVIDYRGSLDADKLTFDLNNQTLNVASYNNDSINADIKLK